MNGYFGQGYFGAYGVGEGTLVLTPPTASLVLTTFAPEVETPGVVTPPTSSLVITGFAPAIGGTVFSHLVSATNTTFPTDSTTHNIVMPTPIDPNDLLLVLLCTDNAVATHTTPSGWTSKGAGTSGCRLTVFAKIAIGDEDGTTVNFISSASERGVARLYHIKNWFTSLTSGIEVNFGGGVSSGGSGTTDPAALTPTWGTLDTFWIATTFMSSNGITFVSGPTGYIGTGEVETGSTSADAQLAYGHRLLNTATEDPGVFTWSGDNFAYGTVTIGVRPESPVVIGTATLTTTGFAPLIVLPKLVTPSTASLVLTSFAPNAAITSLTVFGVIQRELNADNFFGSITRVRLVVHGKTSNAAKPFWARLFNVTLDQYTGNQITDASTVVTEMQSVPFALDSGTNVYEVHFGGESGATYTCYDAVLIAGVA